MQRVTVPIRQSLSYRQTRNTVLVAFTIGLILSSAQIYLDYFSQQNQMRESVQNVVATANRAAFHAAFNLDEAGAVQITRGLVSNQPIVQATITDNASNVLGTAIGDTSTEVSTASRWLFGDPRTISLQLFDETEFNQPVGELTVIVDPSLNAETFIQRSKVVLVSGILRNFILALCIITVFYFTITRSLLKASLPIQQGMTNKRIPMPANHSEDEIGVLISAFNDHLAIIEEQHEQIVDSNINLESQVIERTHELDEKNHQLDKQRQAALMGSKAKSDFLAMMSHEIRTPMNGIIGMAELLERDSRAPKRKEYVDAILDSSKSLLSLMNSVLDYSKYERENFAVEKIAFDLHRLVNGIVFLLSASAEKKHTLLSASFASDLPPFIVGDQEKLRQVLLNLLTNAIKFTSDGAVSLTVTAVPVFRPSSVADVRLRFEVNDTGIGIPEKDKEGIFEAFTQANSSISRRFGGTGMGLAICRQIVEKQGGSIGFKSEASEGSNFWFELEFPIAKSLAQRSEADEQSPTPATPLDILVVDDVPINLKLVEGQLGVDNHRVLMAGDGREALSLLDQNHVDLILMDLHMPVMDGLEASRQIRQLTQENKRDIPIIGMTANLSSEGKEACIASGMNFVVTKPVDYKMICDAIKQAMSLRVMTATATATKPEILPLDIEVLSSHSEALGTDKVVELYREAMKSINNRVNTLRESDSNDIATLEDQAHALAGLCSNFGFPLLGELACNIESAAQCAEKTTLEGLIAQLDALAETTIQVFDQHQAELEKKI